jgi:hypothetical protein
MPEVRGSALTRRQSSIPSIPGIITSEMINRPTHVKGIPAPRSVRKWDTPTPGAQAKLQQTERIALVVHDENARARRFAFR